MADVRRDKNKGFENFAYLCKQSEINKVKIAKDFCQFVDMSQGRVNAFSITLWVVI